MFIVIELQVNAEGQVVSIVTSHNTLPEAQKKYYTVLAYAAISDVPMHSAVILDQMGGLVDRQGFEHPTEVIPPPSEEQEHEPIEPVQGEEGA